MTPARGGVFALGTVSHAYLEFEALPGGDAAELVRTIASLREPRTTMGGVNLVAVMERDPRPSAQSISGLIASGG